MRVCGWLRPGPLPYASVGAGHPHSIMWKLGRGAAVRTWAVRTEAIAQKRAGLRRGRTTARFRRAGLADCKPMMAKRKVMAKRKANTSPVTATEPTEARD